MAEALLSGDVPKEVIKKIVEDAINFEGKYFQAYGAHIDPKPTSSPRPILMNAAGSDLGIDFADFLKEQIMLAASRARK